MRVGPIANQGAGVIGQQPGRVGVQIERRQHRRVRADALAHRRDQLAFGILAGLRHHGAVQGQADCIERAVFFQRVQNAGYKVGFHFDPLIEYPEWETGYQQTLEQVFTTIDPRRVAWVSLGSLRLTPTLRKIMRQRFPRTRLLSGEQVLCADGKWRTFQALRVKMYRTLTAWLNELAPQVPVYMCMETAPVWQKVFGRSPMCDKDVARSLTAPNLGQQIAAP